jgi:hypothetical protein
MTTKITATYTNPDNDEVITRTLTTPLELSDRLAELVGFGLIAELPIEWDSERIEVDTHRDGAVSPFADVLPKLGDIIEITRCPDHDFPPIGHREVVSAIDPNDRRFPALITWRDAEHWPRTDSFKLVTPTEDAPAKPDNQITAWALDRWDSWAMNLLGLTGAVALHGRVNMREQIAKLVTEHARETHLRELLTLAANELQTLRTTVRGIARVDYERIDDVVARCNSAAIVDKPQCKPDGVPTYAVGDTIEVIALSYEPSYEPPIGYRTKVLRVLDGGVHIRWENRNTWLMLDREVKLVERAQRSYEVRVDDLVEVTTRDSAVPGPSVGERLRVLEISESNTMRLTWGIDGWWARDDQVKLVERAQTSEATARSRARTPSRFVARSRVDTT